MNRKNTLVVDEEEERGRRQEVRTMAIVSMIVFSPCFGGGFTKRGGHILIYIYIHIYIYIYMKQVLPKLEKLFWSLKQLYSGIIMLYSCTSKVQQMNDRGHLLLFYNLALLSCDAHGTCGRFWGVSSLLA